MKLGSIAQHLGCELKGDANIEIQRVAAIDEAQPGDLTFVSNRKYALRVKTTTASAVIVETAFQDIPTATLRTANPYLAFARAVELFYQAPAPAPGIDASARISPGAKIGANASIAPFVVIEDDVEIGNNCILYPFVHISRGARIGSDFKAYAHVSVREFCRIGDRVILQDGAKIGTDGYGYAKQDDGSYYKIVQSGIVVVEDDVEIGANSTIDRATIGETRIRRGAKIDNLVQIGHASLVGENALLCAQVGLAGSSKIGRDVILTGQVGVAGHLTIGDGAILTAQSGVASDIEPKSVSSGYPAIDNKTWLKSSTLFKRLPELLKRIEALERKMGGSGTEQED
ncbi:MAG TPA: UDP-3-O-(3-hydroxymyristoyl)glucosamine N-acyltransferase [Terriglobia bacterium]|nr:UDP-3-O-(3-hydroxymyristoyl)glucosamine N-acyltransferase [Terriglobia bacterium]